MRKYREVPDGLAPEGTRKKIPVSTAHKKDGKWKRSSSYTGSLEMGVLLGLSTRAKITAAFEKPKCLKSNGLSKDNPTVNFARLLSYKHEGPMSQFHNYAIRMLKLEPNQPQQPG